MVPRRSLSNRGLAQEDDMDKLIETENQEEQGRLRLDEMERSALPWIGDPTRAEDDQELSPAMDCEKLVQMAREDEPGFSDEQIMQYAMKVCKGEVNPLLVGQAVAKTSVVLTSDQQNAVSGVLNWLDQGERREPYMTLGGFAGTGKTTVIKNLLYTNGSHLCGLIGGKYAVAAFTGKAVSVLRGKGLRQARTLHSLLYDAVAQGDGTFRYYKRLDLGDIRFVVVDEASMIHKDLFKDLMEHEIPVLFVGDMGQLEPIGDDPYLMSNPRLKLTQIHRQAAQSDIIQASVVARSGMDPMDYTPKGTGEVRIGDGNVFLEVLTNGVDMAITGFNKTRFKANDIVRKHKKYKGVLEEGERVICLQNNRNQGVFNGMICTVQKIRHIGKLFILADLQEEGGAGSVFSGVRMLTEQFGQPKIADTDETKYWTKGITFWDYAYCLTTHKAQGSEAPRVAVLEEIWWGKWDPARWRYTAITRAAKELIYCRVN